MTNNVIQDVTDTARLVAMFRAQESERPDGLFVDPFARRLAGEGAFKMGERLPSGDRFAAIFAVRTKVIDDMIEAVVASGKIATVVCLGAGLDTRPHRLALPSQLRWIEADLPKMVHYKAGLIGEEPARCQLERHAVDLGVDAARQAFLRDVVAKAGPSLVLTEGLLYYLLPRSVAALASDLHGLGNVQDWIADLLSWSTLQWLRRSWGPAMGTAQMHFAPLIDPALTFRSWGWMLSERRDWVTEATRLERAPMLSHLVPKAFGAKRWLVGRHYQFLAFRRS